MLLIAIKGRSAFHFLFYLRVISEIGVKVTYLGFSSVSQCFLFCAVSGFFFVLASVGGLEQTCVPTDRSPGLLISNIRYEN